MASLRRSLGFLVPYWPIAAAAFLSMAVTALASLAAPQFLRIAIDGGIVGGGVDSLVLASAGLLAVAAFRGLFTFLQGYLSEKTSQGVAYDLRNDHLRQAADPQLQLPRPGPDRPADDPRHQRRGDGAPVHRPGLPAAAGRHGDAARQRRRCCCCMNWRLALAITGHHALHLPGLRPLRPDRAAPVSTRPGEAGGAEHRPPGEPGRARGGQGLRARGLRDGAVRPSQRGAARAEHPGHRGPFSTTFPLIFFFASLGTVIVIWYGGNQVIGGALSLGELVAFNTYLGFLMFPIFMLGMIAAMMTRAGGLGQAHLRGAGRRERGEGPARRRSLPPIQGRVAFEDVSFRYVGAEHDALSQRQLRRRARPDGGHRGHHRLGQEHHHQPDPALLRRHGAGG